MICVVIQARIGSSRLPGKVLLPIGKRPAVVLAAQRAANSGAKVIVAISTDRSDNVLASSLADYQLEIVRGPLQDVLKRFVLATENLSESDVVVRLTADNVFPDGAFIGEIAEALGKSGCDYLGTSSPADGLPYGLSAEAFTVSALRAADRETTTLFEREHVTPRMRSKNPGPPFRPRGRLNDLSYLRCTIDSLDDYERVAQVFSGIEDPVSISWSALCGILEKNSTQNIIPKRHFAGTRTGELVLGTAQLGLPAYGRTNAIGRLSSDAATELITSAVHHGVDCVDTARAYDRAEPILGEALKKFGDRIKIITKLSLLAELPNDATCAEIRALVDASVFRSCKELRVMKLPVLLLHRWHHRTSHQGEVWKRLLELKNEGIVQKLGASVSTPDEARDALYDETVEHLQIPINLLDDRWERAGINRLAVERPNVVIHARSVFLQGILAGSAASWPAIENVDASQIVNSLEALSAKLDRVSRADLCLAYVRAQSWIHGVVVGVETKDQLTQLVDLFQNSPLTREQQAEVRHSFSLIPDRLLNPASWPTK